MKKSVAVSNLLSVRYFQDVADMKQSHMTLLDSTTCDDLIFIRNSKNTLVLSLYDTVFIIFDRRLKIIGCIFLC